MKIINKTHLFLILTGAIIFFGAPMYANAECRLKDTYPAIELNKVGTPATYADGEKLTGTVSTATGFNCEGFRVEFRACPSGFTGAKCDITDGALVLANPGPAITSGKAIISWNVKKLRTDYDKYAIRAVVGTGVGGQSSQVFSSEIIIRAAGLCSMTKFTALKRDRVMDLKISSNSNCEGRTATVQLWTQDARGTQVSGPIIATGRILNNQFTNTWTINSPTSSFFLRGTVYDGGDPIDVMFLNGDPTPPPGGRKYSCNSSNQCVENASGTYTNSNCDYKCVGATATQSYTFNITNPLKGGPNDLFDIINIVTQWIMYISIPLAVLYIMYAGFLMLTAGPTPANFQKGRDILKYVVLGLAIIFIGKGFVSLIISIIELGGGTTSTQNSSSLGAPAGTNCVNNLCENTGLRCTNFADCQPVAGIGEPCTTNSECVSGQICNRICQRKDGNGLGEACQKSANPSNCKSTACNTVGTSESGTCVENPTGGGSSSSGQQYQNILTVKETIRAGGYINSPYEVNLSVLNPIDPSLIFNWQIVEGALPPGTSLEPATTATEGSIHGTPTKAGTYNVTIQAMDIANKQYGREALGLEIRQP